MNDEMDEDVKFQFIVKQQCQIYHLFVANEDKKVERNDCPA
jgi:hypothetical protein